MNSIIQIKDPTGKTRTLTLNSEESPYTVGPHPQDKILLRDPTVPETSLELYFNKSTSSWWVRKLNPQCYSTLNGIPFQESAIPPHHPVHIGETEFQLSVQEKLRALPTFPKNMDPWLTLNTQGRSLLWMAKKVSATSLSVFLAGETGTGKEVIAQLIHAWSERASGPFIALNCGSLPLTLAESELFGHLKGSFTGAHRTRPGALLQAHNGTLFLDEIGDLPMEIQVKLLRFLENGEIRSIGSDYTGRADVRIICATHKPLDQLVEEGRFRQDLYYRIASVTLEIPPLRSRPDDIRMLAEKYVREFQKKITPQAILRLQSYDWPGNVRELKHTIERAVGLSGALKDVLHDVDFEFLLENRATLKNPNLFSASGLVTLKEMERTMLLRTLRITRGNRQKAAKILGVARSTLFEMIKRHGIPGFREVCSFNPQEVEYKKVGAPYLQATNH